MLNGDGLRVVLWVAGCSHCCKDCHNPVTWDPNGGLYFDESAKAELFEELKKDYVEWLRRRRDLFREVSGTKKTLRLTMIASAGIKQNMYASALQGKLSMEDLFL